MCEFGSWVCNSWSFYLCNISVECFCMHTSLAFKYMYTCLNNDTYVYRVWARLRRCIPCVWAYLPLHKSVSLLLWVHRQVKVIMPSVCTYTRVHSAYVAMNLLLCVCMLVDMNRIAMYVYVHIWIWLMFSCTCGHDHAYEHVHKWCAYISGHDRACVCIYVQAWSCYTLGHCTYPLYAYTCGHDPLMCAYKGRNDRACASM